MIAGWIVRKEHARAIDEQIEPAQIANGFFEQRRNVGCVDHIMPINKGAYAVRVLHFITQRL